MRLLPEIPTGAPRDQVLEMLGVKGQPVAGKPSHNTCIETWDISPGYRFGLVTVLTERDGKEGFWFRSAGVSAQGKPGYPPDEYHMIYPMRYFNEMIQSSSYWLRPRPERQEGADRP
jgi:hypothetical protein